MSMLGIKGLSKNFPLCKVFPGFHVMFNLVN